MMSVPHPAGAAGTRCAVLALALSLALAAGCGPSGSRSAGEEVVELDAAAMDGGRGGGGRGGAGGVGSGEGGSIPGGGGGTAGTPGGAGGSLGMGGFTGVDAAPDVPGGSGGSTPAPDAAEPDTAPPADMGPPAAGLVSRWKLDEGMGTSTADSTNTGNHGSLAGGAAWIAGRTGLQYPNPGALRFDGVDDHVELGTKNIPAFERPHSVAFWASQGTGGGANQIVVGLSGAAGQRLKLGFRSGLIAMWRSAGAVVMAPMRPAGWHHVAFTFDGTTQRLYVDGAEVAVSTAAPEMGAVSSARIATQSAGTERFAGEVDEVRIYDRALGAAEVAALHAGEP